MGGSSASNTEDLMTKNILEVDDVSFSYDGRTMALDHVSFGCPEGSIFAVLGPNGAGKSTLFQLVLGLLSPSAGHVKLLGESPTHRPTKRHIGWVPSEVSQSLMLNVTEYFSLLASTQPEFDLGYAFDLLAPFDLDGAQNKLLSELSHGMRKKAQLIGAVSHRPSLLLLDEPFSGLDPQSHHILETMLNELSRNGATIMLASHQIEVVDALASHVAVMRKGATCAVGTPAALQEQFDRDNLRQVYLAATQLGSDAEERAADLRQLLINSSPTQDSSRRTPL